MADDFDDLEDGGTVQQRPHARPDEGASTLTVRAGPDAGATCSIDATQPGPLLVGQSPACHIRLTDRQVSRRHAALDLADGQVRVRDLRSTNGTYVHDALGSMANWGGQVCARGTHSPAAPPWRATTPAANVVRQGGLDSPKRRMYPILDRLSPSMGRWSRGRDRERKGLLAEARTTPATAPDFRTGGSTARSASHLVGPSSSVTTGRPTAVATRRGV